MSSDDAETGIIHRFTTKKELIPEYGFSLVWLSSEGGGRYELWSHVGSRDEGLVEDTSFVPTSRFRPILTHVGTALLGLLAGYWFL